MGFTEAELKRIEEKIDLPMTQLRGEMELRFQELNGQLEHLQKHDIGQLRNSQSGMFTMIQEDIKAPLDSLVADQTFVRNTRRLVGWIATAVIALWSFWTWAVPRIEAWIEKLSNPPS